MSHNKSQSDINFFLQLGYFPRFKQSVTLDLGGISKSRYESASEEELITEAKNAFDQSFDALFAKHQASAKHVVPISGGMDSRAILCALLERTPADTINTYTFGTPGTYDFDIGCMIAKAAGTHHTAIPLDDHPWTLNDFDEAAQRFDHQTFLFHHAPMTRLKSFEDGITWSGYIGDAVTGGHLKKAPSETLKLAKQIYVKNRKESRSINVLKEGAQEVCQGVGGESFAHEALSYDEQVLFAEVGSITAPHVLMKGFSYETPFINSPIFDFFMSIPSSARRDQNLFKTFLLQTYPALFTLPCKTSFGLPLTSSRPRKFLRRARNKMLNIRRSYRSNKQFKALPMTNFFDVDLMIRTHKGIQESVYARLQELKKRDCVPSIDIDTIWSSHMEGRDHHGDVLKILFSLETNLQGLGKGGGA